MKDFLGFLMWGVIIIIIIYIRDSIREKKKKQVHKEDNEHQQKLENDRYWLNINRYEEKEKNYPIVLSPYWRTQLILPTPVYSHEQPQRGASDLFFANNLKKYFSNIFINLKLGYYYPDIVLHNESSKFYLDIEIDEIYGLKNKEIIHSIGNDDRRNEYFLNRGWHILRFSEEQVRKETDSCCKFVAQVYAYYTLDKNPLNKLWLISNLKFTEQWTSEEGYKNMQKNVRKEWLDNNSKITNEEDLKSKKNRKFGYKYDDYIFSIFNTDKYLTENDLILRMGQKSLSNKNEIKKLINIWEEHSLLCRSDNNRYYIGSILTNEYYKLTESDLTWDEWLKINGKK